MELRYLENWKSWIILESDEESLIRKLTGREFNEWHSNHRPLEPTQEDIKLYERIILSGLSGLKINIYGLKKGWLLPRWGEITYWECKVSVYFESPDLNFYIIKYDDEWYGVIRESRIMGHFNDFWILDTKEGFEQLHSVVFRGLPN